MSKACAIVVTRTYTGEVLLGPWHGPNEPGRGPQVVSLWTPNEALNLLYIPLSVPRTLIVHRWRAGAVGKPASRERRGSKVVQGG